MNNYAPIWKRIVAGFIDYTIVFVYTFAYIFAFGELDSDGEMGVTGNKTNPILIFWFVYLIGVEQWAGATLGNSIVGIKAISMTGNKLTWGQSIKRHLLGAFDFNLSIITYIVIKNTEHRQRIGDIWAKSIVVNKISPPARHSAR